MTDDALSKERVASSLAWIDDGLCKATATLKRLRHASDYDGDRVDQLRRHVETLATLRALIDERARLIAAVAESRKVDEALSEHGMTVEGNEVMLKRLRGLRRQLWALDAWKAGT
jgi:hypothetical protein